MEFLLNDTKTLLSTTALFLRLFYTQQFMSKENNVRCVCTVAVLIISQVDVPASLSLHKMANVSV